MVDYIKEQLAFSEWVTDWLQKNPGSSPDEKIIQPDILDIVAIFKILGFEITFIDITDPKNSNKLENSSSNIKIIASCVSSGLRCAMELETTCRCPENVINRALWANPINELLKYDINKKDLDKSLAVTSEIQFIIRSVTNHFLNLINKSDENKNVLQSEICTKEELATFDTIIISKQDTFVDINSYNPTIQITSPREGTSKSLTRYRSLDTLTGNFNHEEISEPGSFNKNDSNEKKPVVSSSSPNVSFIRETSPSTSSPRFKSTCQNCEPMLSGYSKLLQVQTIVTEVLGIMENNQNAAKLNYDISKVKGSIDSLCENLKKPAVSKLREMKPKCRAPIRSSQSTIAMSIGSAKLLTRSSGISGSQNPRPVLKGTSSITAPKKPLENVATGCKSKTSVQTTSKFLHNSKPKSATKK